MDINNKTLALFRTDFKDAVANLESKYGVKIELGNIRYTTNEFSGRIDVTNSEFDKELETFKQYCGFYGLKESDYGKKITIGMDEYIIVGINPRARKNCFLIRKVSDGQTYTCGEEPVKFGLLMTKDKGE